MHITPEIVEAGYELLRATPPFKRWKLPPADDLEFRAVPLKDNDQGECWKRADGTICLTINPNRHKTLGAMLMTLAHEMVHLRQDQLCDNSHHDGKFPKLAEQVCREHLFDPGQF